LRTAFHLLRGDHQLARQRLGAVLDPELPVDVRWSGRSGVMTEGAVDPVESEVGARLHVLGEDAYGSLNSRSAAGASPPRLSRVASMVSSRLGGAGAWAK
jgi:hypothetical protein